MGSATFFLSTLFFILPHPLPSLFLYLISVVPVLSYVYWLVALGLCFALNVVVCWRGVMGVAARVVC